MKRWTVLGFVVLSFVSHRGLAQVPQPGQALAVLGGPNRAYDHQWAPMHGAPTLTFSGNALFSFVTGTTGNYAGPGDAIRTCYGVDSTQGGHNEAGLTEVSWFRHNQGFAPNNPTPGVNVGLISIQSASESSVGGDVCMSPFFSLVGATGGHKDAVQAVAGIFAATSAASFPILWEINFSWGPTTILVPNVIGNSSGDLGLPGLALGLQHAPPIGGSNPLLANVIFEIQGPLNGPSLGALGEQYYLASTLEWTGLGLAAAGTDFFGAPVGTGGVTNNNEAWGSEIFVGSPLAGATNLVSHTRLFGTHVVPPTITAASAPPGLTTPLGSGTFRNGRIEFCQALAFGFSQGLAGSEDTSHCDAPTSDPMFEPTWCSRFLWARNRFIIDTDGPVVLGGNPVPGAGAPDWRISSKPLSTVDLYVLDHASGAFINGNINAKVPASYTTGGAGTIPAVGSPAIGFLGAFSVLFNRAAFLWSVTNNLSTLQGRTTGSWDTTPAGGGPLLPASPGSTALAPIATVSGTLTVPLIADTATTLFSGNAALTFGSSFTPSDDFFADGSIGTTTFFSSLFEGNYVPLTSGISELVPAGSGITIGIPDPSLAGVNLYLAAATSYFDIGTFAVVNTGVANALTVTLQ